MVSGTVSEQLRVTPSEILGYFNFFAGLPGLRVAAYQPYVRVFGDSGTVRRGFGYEWAIPSFPSLRPSYANARTMK